MDQRITKAALFFGSLAAVFAAAVTISKALEASCNAYDAFSKEVDRVDELKSVNVTEKEEK